LYGAIDIRVHRMFGSVPSLVILSATSKGRELSGVVMPRDTPCPGAALPIDTVPCSPSEWPERSLNYDFNFISGFPATWGEPVIHSIKSGVGRHDKMDSYHYIHVSEASVLVCQNSRTVTIAEEEGDQKNAILDFKLNLLYKSKKIFRWQNFVGWDQVTYLSMETAIIISVSDFQILFTRIFCYHS